MRVATFNIRFKNALDGTNGWRHRRAATAAQLNAIDFDVCGLQEVLADQRDYLAASVTKSRWYGVGRSDGRNKGEQSPIIVRGERLAVEEWTTRWLSERPTVAGSRGWDAKIPRVATMLRGTLEGLPVGVLNTHFDHRGQRAQENSARLILELTRSIPARWIVMGDFNVELGSPALRSLTESGFRSVLPHDAGGTFHAFSGATDRQRIDHILVDDGWEVLESGIVHDRPDGRLPSDHWPVIATLRPR